MRLAIDNEDHVRGSSTAPVTALVYGDYECPYTRALEFTIAQLREIHPHAEMAAEAAEAVAALGGPEKFWIMHDTLFANQYDLEQESLERYAKAAGVDVRTYRKAVATHQFADRVERDLQSGIANGVEGTPSIFINGERYHGRRDVDSLRAAITAYS